MNLFRLTFFRKQCMACVMITACLLGSVSSALAGYTPRSGSKPYQGPDISGVRRGGICDQPTNNGVNASNDSDEPTFIALAPQQYSGQTISTQPTLSWFIPDDTVRDLQLRVYQETDDGRWMTVIDSPLGVSQPGYMSYTLADAEALTAGETYIWQVMLMCSPDRPSKNPVIAAQLEVIPDSQTLANPGNNRLQQAENYAEAGLWYDALALLMEMPITEAETTYRRQLLVDLAEAETAWNTENSAGQAISDDLNEFIQQVLLIADVE